MGQLYSRLSMNSSGDALGVMSETTAPGNSDVRSSHAAHRYVALG